jgi:hypothetical protein
VQCDDDLYRVDRVFLGPKGKPWPFRATYRAYGFWAGLTLVGVVLWRVVHLPWSIVVLIGIVIAGFFGAQGVDKHLTYDRPIVAEIIRVVQELAAPRPDLHPAPVSVSSQITVDRWRAGAVPPRRWWVRAAASVVHGFGRTMLKVLGRSRGRVYANGRWNDVR